MVHYAANVLPTDVDSVSLRQGGLHNTHEAIRQLLKEQRKVGEKITKDPIFRSYRADIKLKEAKLRRKGWKEAPKPQIDEDLDAEGHGRVMQLIAEAAVEAKKECAGVWAKFGKPYQPMGKFEMLERSLPKLNRDEMNSDDSDDEEGGKAMKNKQKGNKARRRKLVMPVQSSAVLATDEDVKKNRLLERQTVLQFSTVERREALFPLLAGGSVGNRSDCTETQGESVQVPLVHSEKRMVAAQISTSWLNSDVARREAQDPKSFGQVEALLPPSAQLVLTIKTQLRQHSKAGFNDKYTVRSPSCSPSRPSSMATSPTRRGSARFAMSGDGPTPQDDVDVTQDSEGDGWYSTRSELPAPEGGGKRLRPVRRPVDPQKGHMIAASREEGGAGASPPDFAASTMSKTATKQHSSTSQVKFNGELQSEGNAAERSHPSKSSQAMSLAKQRTVTQRSNSFREDLHGALGNNDCDSDISLDAKVPASHSTARPTSPHAVSGHTETTEDDGFVEAGEPEWQLLTEKVRPPLGQESNPVYRWHNDYVDIRQRGRKQMQELLWTRLLGRTKARTQPSLTFGLYNAVMAEMEYTMGNRPTCARRGVPPRNPFEQAALFTGHMGDDDNPLRKNMTALELEDVHLLERFYNQLCLLVEAQRASEPMSLLMIQLVKELLEAGQTLHLPMLQKLVARFAGFIVKAGLVRYNMFLLPIFTFIRKCCGVSDTALENLLIQHGIDKAVYPPPDAPPRPVTPLSPASRPSSRSSTHAESRQASGRSHGGPPRPGSRGRAASRGSISTPTENRPTGSARGRVVGLPPRPPSFRRQSSNSVAIGEEAMDTAAVVALEEIHAAVEEREASQVLCDASEASLVAIDENKEGKDSNGSQEDEPLSGNQE